jgi:hypothetical protein
VLQLGEGGEVYWFSLLEETRATDPDELDLRLFGLRPLPPQTLDQLADLLSQYIKPHWPVWVPLWRFPTEGIRMEIDSQVDALVEPAGPTAWKIATADLLGTLHQVQKATGAPETHRAAE